MAAQGQSVVGAGASTRTARNQSASAATQTADDSEPDAHQSQQLRCVSSADLARSHVLSGCLNMNH